MLCYVMLCFVMWQDVINFLMFLIFHTNLFCNIVTNNSVRLHENSNSFAFSVAVFCFCIV